MLRNFSIFLLVLTINGSLFSQNDSIKLVNGNILVGELKSLNRSVLVFKTPYSDSDFSIKWLEVKEFYSKRQFIVYTNDGRIIHGQINTNRSNKKEVVINDNDQKITTSLSEIVYIDRFGEKFFSRLHAEIDAGITLRKAKNYIEITGNVKLGYTTDHWKYSSIASAVYSEQDSTDNISRYEVEVNALRFLANDWFLMGGVGLLSNSDQDIKMRATESVAGGYFFDNTNRATLGSAVGLSYVNESYTNSTEPGKNSLEAFMRVQYDKYDVGNNLSLHTSVMASPSITEKRRVRVDFNLNLKYKITSDLYIKTGITYNYDNQPAVGAPKGDYTFQTSFGWDNN